MARGSERSAFDEKDLIELGRVSAVAAHPSGEWLAVEVARLDEHGAAYVSDLWRVPLSGGEPRRLTRGAHQYCAPAFAHDGALLFLSNRPAEPGGDSGGHTQIFRFDPAGGEPEAVTDEPLGVSSFVAAKRADALAWVTSWQPGVEADKQREAAKERAERGPSARVYKRMPVKHWDHWLPTTRPHVIVKVGVVRRDLTPDAGRERWMPALAISEDGTKVATTRRTISEVDRLGDTVVEVFDTRTSELITTLGGASRVSNGGLVWTPDGTELLATRHARSGTHFGKNQLVVYDLATGDFRALGEAHDGWLSACDVSADGQTALAVGDWRGDTPLWLVDMERGEPVRLTAEAAGGTHGAARFFERDGVVRVAGWRSRVSHPPEPFTCAAREGAEPRLAANLSGWAECEWARIEEHRAAGPDGAPVHYRIVRPPASEAPGPGLMWIHGGPVGAWGDVWHWRWNPLVAAARGYTLALPNPRGSTGFGQEYVEGIWGNVWGATCYEDLMAVADAFGADAEVDAERITAMGGSFGGYMTNWIGTQTDRFCCLVTHAGLTDLRAFHGVTDQPAWWALMYGVEPFSDRAAFDEYSPLAHIDGWSSPTLIIHGELDYRVPIGEALVLFEALQYNGVESELLAFPDENHWILKPRNIVEWYDHTLEFIGRYAPGSQVSRDEDE